MANSNTRHTVWLSPEAWEQVERRYRKDNCSTKKMNMLVGEKLNEQAQFQARALSNKIKKLYYNYKIGIREE